MLLLLAFLLRSLIKFILGLDFINSSNEGSYFGRLRLLNISLFLLVQKLAELFGIIESISKRQKLLIIIKSSQLLQLVVSVVFAIEHACVPERHY